MAIPVVFAAELFPFDALNAEINVDNAVAALNAEIKAHFDGAADLAGVPDDASNVVKVDTVYGKDTGAAMLQASVLVGFKGVTLDDALELARTFVSSTFPRIDVLDQQEFEDAIADEEAEKAKETSTAPTM